MSDVNPDDLLRVTLASIGDALVTTDAGGAVTYLNPVAEGLTGWPLADARGRPLAEIFRIVNEFTREPVNNPADRALREGVVVGLANHTVLIARDGTERPIDDSAAPIRNSDGAIVGVVLVFRDVTERRQRERDLAQSEARKAAVLDAALDGILSIDAGGRVLEWNPAAEAMFGRTADEVRGRELAELIIPPAFRDAHRRGMAHYLATGEGPALNRRLELAALRADGTEFPVELSILPIETDGPPTFTGYIRDITERKREEAEQAERVRLAGTAGRHGPGAGHRRPAARRAPAVHRGAGGARGCRLRPGVGAGRGNRRRRGRAGPQGPVRGSTRTWTATAATPGCRWGAYEIGRIARDRRPLLTNDVLHDPNVSDPDWAAREGMVSFAGFPLLVEGRCVGVLAMFGRTPLSEAVLTDLAPLAEQVAVFLERKRAEERLRASEQRGPAGHGRGRAGHLGLARRRGPGHLGENDRLYEIFGLPRDAEPINVASFVGGLRPPRRRRRVRAGDRRHPPTRRRVLFLGPLPPGRRGKFAGPYSAVIWCGTHRGHRSACSAPPPTSPTASGPRRSCGRASSGSGRRSRRSPASSGPTTPPARMRGEQPGWAGFTGPVPREVSGLRLVGGGAPRTTPGPRSTPGSGRSPRGGSSISSTASAAATGGWRLCTIRAVPLLDGGGRDPRVGRRPHRRHRGAERGAAAEIPGRPDRRHPAADRPGRGRRDHRPPAGRAPRGGPLRLRRGGGRRAGRGAAHHRRPTSRGDDAGIGTLVGRRPLAAFGDACVRALDAGDPFVVTDADDDPAGRPGLPGRRAVRAAVCVPLRKSGVLTRRDGRAPDDRAGVDPGRGRIGRDGRRPLLGGAGAGPHRPARWRPASPATAPCSRRWIRATASSIYCTTRTAARPTFASWR